MSSKKIFIIEDDASILYDLEAQFTNTGFEIEVSEANEDDDEIINLMHEFEPDYIILDLILPKMEGFDLLKKIKADPELRDKEVFIFTDLSKEDSRERSLEMGADYVFFKEEFDTFQFAEKVIKIIKNQEKLTGEEDEEEAGLE